MARLFAFRENRLGFYFDIGPKAILGRGPECDLILSDPGVSPQHAEIFQVDDKYYIADLGSAEGTSVNLAPITMQTRLNPFDSIKIGQESFIFEPGISVVTGPASAAIIIEGMNENVQNLIMSPVEEAAAQVTAEDIPALMGLAHQLNRTKEYEKLKALMLRYLQSRFGITFMAILWPAQPPVKRLISLLTSHEDKRLLLSQTPFLQATRDHVVTLWPSSISALYFNQGRRKLSLTGKPALVGPLDDGLGQVGLMYLENLDNNFTSTDLNTFAAFLGLINPAIARWYNKKCSHNDLGNSHLSYSSMILSSSSSQIKASFATASQAAMESGPIFISGEPGTGKSALAEYIHKASLRRNNRLIHINLAPLSSDTIERALFGQVATALGDSEQVGLLEEADGGTLYLRHVGYLSPALQKYLLAVIESGLFSPIGATHPKATDIRIVTSASIDLWAMVEMGTFRRDLYLRLNQLNISMPPLREIKGELEEFLVTFMKKAALELGLPFNGLDKAALECLKMYNWPGNMTELETEAKLLIMFSRNGWVAMEDLPLHLRLAPETFGDNNTENSDPNTIEAERYHLVTALSACDGDLEKVATILNQKPEHIILKMRTCGVDPIDYQPPQVQNQPPGSGFNS